VSAHVVTIAGNNVRDNNIRQNALLNTHNITS